jgi:hypothetical protein
VRALFFRRGSLRASMRAALAEFGAPHEFDDFGALHVAGAGQKTYVVWLCSNPPGMPEFFVAHQNRRPPAKRVVVGPSTTIAAIRYRQTAWLAARSQIAFYDEGLLRLVARRMASGTL